MPATPQADPRMLIAIRVVVVTSLILAALIIQFTSEIVLPISYLYLTAGVCYALTLVYIIISKSIASTATNLYIQFAGDVFVETMLVYFTGGLDSPFSFLYLVSIVTASMLLYRRGGLVTASGAAILYGGLVDLMYYDFLPSPPQSFFTPTQWSSVRLYLNIATNFAGFYATALLTSFVSEKLKRTSEELDENRQNLAQLKALNENVVASIPSGLLTLDESGRIAFANPAASEILGHTAAGIHGRHITDVGFVSAEGWSDLSGRMASETIIRGELEFDRGGGDPITLGYALTPLRTRTGTPAGLTLIFQDLTEMKKLEAQLRMKDRMAAVGELSAGIAHEIRNPLAAIAGSVQVLKNSKNLALQEQRLMTIILKESERLNSTIGQFLRFVKPHERRQVEFDIAASLIETLELLLNSSEVGPDHRIEWKIDPSSYIVQGDPDQMRQVFWNLSRNALQAMPNGGLLHVAASPEGDSYEIRFDDEGRGMSERERRVLFQPFRTNFPSGTGLGMAISFRIIQEHGGRIEVESAQDKGTTISLILPIAPVVERGASGERQLARKLQELEAGK
ncbi:MAG TPA: ATP-binding protein [Thermoanaerobaculia bacterium]|nr:ATP-binding protein [Thermoanaerobaculia bacterium]